MSLEWVEIGELQAKKNGSIDPSKFLDETFELHSIPSHDKGNAEILTGREIGSSKQIVQENDVMISKIVPHIRRAMVVPKKGNFRQIASSEWIVFRSERIYPNYLKHLLISDFFNAQFMATVSGVGGSLLRARPTFVSKIKIPLPPLTEQKRIAQILDKADELRQKRQQSIEKLDELLQATFIDMFGDPITNPKGWEICEVGKVTDCIVPARDKPKSFTGDIPWITTDDLNHLGFTETSKKNIGLTNEEITLAKARLIPKNSVVISCVGNLGLASIASDNFVMNQQLHSFQCGDKILPEFLIFCLPFQKGYMLSRATSTTVPYMNKSVCNSIPVTVPPLDLQKKWKLIFENSNKQKQVLKKQLAQQENLFQSLQQRAFNGEL